MEEKKLNNKTGILTILSELVDISSYGSIGKEYIRSFLYMIIIKLIYGLK